MTAYWLFKSEPDEWSWEQQVQAGEKGEQWTGVRNHLAKKHMKAMKIGDMGFFYHSNVGKEIVGIVQIIKEFEPDPTDESGKFGMVTIKAIQPLHKAVPLSVIKQTPELQKMSLVTCSRLSVQPVTVDEWQTICALGGINSSI